MKLMASQDAVTESLGFMLLGLITTLAVAAVIVIGYPVFSQSINDAHMQNMEEGFYLMSYNANKVVSYESPVQSSELRMDGGTLGVFNDGYINVSYRYWDGTADVYDNENLSTSAIEYWLNDEKIAYLMGGVFKKKAGEPSIILDDPSMYQYDTGSSSTLVIPMVEYQTGTTTVAGNGYARMSIASPFYSRTMGTLSYPSSIHATNVEEIEVTICSDYGDSLSQYFQDRFGFHETANSNGVITLEKSYPGSGITLYIPISLISVTIN